MKTDRIERGMLARSKAGHDKGRVYVIQEADDIYVYLTDGRIRTLERPKKKKRIHVQMICEKHDITGIDDGGIRRIIKEAKSSPGKGKSANGSKEKMEDGNVKG